MTVVAFVLAASLLVILAAVLGVMREAVILRGEVKALASLITTPPAPSFLGEALPAAVAHQLSGLGSWTWSDNLEYGDSRVVAFLTADCSGCSALVSDLRAAVDSGALPSEVAKRGIMIVLATKDEQSSSSLLTAAHAVAGQVIIDANSELSRACEIRQAPALLQVHMPDAIVVDHHVGGEVEWILNVLQPTRTAVALN